VFVHGWGIPQIANNRITNNAATLGGGINVGQGEFPPVRGGGLIADPGSGHEPTGSADDRNAAASTAST